MERLTQIASGEAPELPPPAEKKADVAAEEPSAAPAMSEDQQEGIATE
jgi:hypothetical protein